MLKLIEQAKPGANREEGQPQGQPPSPPPNQSQPQTQERALPYTGETKSITIPDNIPITMMVRGESGVETSQLEIANIRIGDMLQVWYADKEKGVLSKISINRFLEEP